ncbi:DDO.2 family protein [Megaselia abdita]
MKRIAIIGGGVNGFACGVQLAEYFKEKAEIILISELFSPDTTGDGSAGLWGPYMTLDTTPEKICKWSKDTHDYLKSIWQSEHAGEAGVCLVSHVTVLKKDEESSLKNDHFWKDIVYGYREITPNEMQKLNECRKIKYKEGVRFVTFTSEPKKFLPFMMKRFKELGGRCEQRKVQNFENFINQCDYDVVINCTGLGARELLNDNLTHPIRGQVIRVKAKWVYEVFSDDSSNGNYIIPK